MHKANENSCNTFYIEARKSACESFDVGSFYIPFRVDCHRH